MIRTSLSCEFVRSPEWDPHRSISRAFGDECPRLDLHSSTSTSRLAILSDRAFWRTATWTLCARASQRLRCEEDS